MYRPLPCPDESVSCHGRANRKPCLQICRLCSNSAGGISPSGLTVRQIAGAAESSVRCFLTGQVLCRTSCRPEPRYLNYDLCLAAAHCLANSLTGDGVGKPQTSFSPGEEAHPPPTEIWHSLAASMAKTSFQLCITPRRETGRAQITSVKHRLQAQDLAFRLGQPGPSCRPPESLHRTATLHERKSCHEGHSKNACNQKSSSGVRTQRQVCLLLVAVRSPEQTMHQENRNMGTLYAHNRSTNFLTAAQ